MGVPATWKVFRESQFICVHIPMNCLSDKLTILLYADIRKKLHVFYPCLGQGAGMVFRMMLDNEQAAVLIRSGSQGVQEIFEHFWITLALGISSISLTY